MNFVKLLDDSEVAKNYISKELISDIVAKIVPPQNKSQLNFFMDKKACNYLRYGDDRNGKLLEEGDPGLYFHEFCLALARVGLEVCKDLEEKRKSDVPDQLQYFFSELMGHNMFLKLRNESTAKKIDVSMYTKEFVKNLIEFEKIMSGHCIVDYSKVANNEQIETVKAVDPVVEEIKALLSSEPDMQAVKNIIQGIDGKIPPLVYTPDQDDSNPPPYKTVAAVVGEQIPVGKDQRAKPKPKPVRRNNKDKPIKFEGR